MPDKHPPAPWYTYMDFMTKKIKRTRGRFDGWTEPTGLLNVRYAIFRRPRSSIFVPAYLLTKETRAAIDAIETAKGETPHA